MNTTENPFNPAKTFYGVGSKTYNSYGYMFWLCNYRNVSELASDFEECYQDAKDSYPSRLDYFINTDLEYSFMNQITYWFKGLNLIADYLNWATIEFTAYPNVLLHFTREFIVFERKDFDSERVMIKGEFTRLCYLLAFLKKKGLSIEYSDFAKAVLCI